MSTLLDLALAGSRIATWVGVALIGAAVVVLVWVVVRGVRQLATEQPVTVPAIFEANTVRRHRHPARRSSRSVVRHQVVDGPTVVIPVLREQTEFIPPVGGRRG